MTITIEQIHSAKHGFTIMGLSNQALEDIHVYFQTSNDSGRSPNLRATSNQNGQWAAMVPGIFPTGTKITAYARIGRAKLACLTQTL